MWIFDMLSCSVVPMAFCFAVINNVAAIILKAINEFFRKHIFKMKMVDDNFRWRFENHF